MLANIDINKHILIVILKKLILNQWLIKFS